MTLPKVKHPTFTITIPSTKKKVKFRPYLVLEEKMLLIGQQSQNMRDKYDAVKNVINNCAIDKFDINSHPTFDLDYIFIKLRAQSVGNRIEIKYKDQIDQQEYPVIVDLDSIEITFPEQVPDIVDVDDQLKIKLKYPVIETVDQVMDTVTAETTPSQLVDMLVVKCIDQIIDKEDIYFASEATEEELIDFINSLDRKTYSKIEAFFKSMPQISHQVSYTRKDGTEVPVELKGLQDFFIF